MALLSITHLGTDHTELVDGRTIRHLSCDDDNGEHVVLMDGQGREYLADSADWAEVKYLSEYVQREEHADEARRIQRRSFRG